MLVDVSYIAKRFNIFAIRRKEKPNIGGAQMPSSRAEGEPGFLPYQVERSSSKDCGIPGESVRLVGQKIRLDTGP